MGTIITRKTHDNIRNDEVIIMENYGTGACIAEHNGDMTINVITEPSQAGQMSISINGMSISDLSLIHI